MCERYREAVMGLVDNELSDQERRDVELHLLECPDCKAEYEQFRQLVHLTNSLEFPQPHPMIWDHYYEGVCRRMHRAASWGLWGGLSVGLLGLANVLFFVVPTSSLTIAAGMAALTIGAILLWSTFACQCS